MDQSVPILTANGLKLLRAFDFQLINPTNPWKSRSYSVFVEENMWVKVTESEVAA